MDKTKRSNIIRKSIGWGLLIVFALTLLYVRFFVGSVVAVSGESMYPTFNSGDYVFGTVMHDNAPIKHDDIIIFKYDGRYLIKRVVGVPGDTMPATEDTSEITLSDTQYYVLGDNRQNSLDSRNFGPIERDVIKFKYAGIHWTSFTLFVTFVIPIICLIAIVTIICVPSPKTKRPKFAEVVSTSEGQGDLNPSAETGADNTANADTIEVKGDAPSESTSDVIRIEL